MKTPELIHSVHRNGTKAFYMSPANVRFNDLTIMINGSAEYKVDSKTVVLKSGDAVFIPKGCLRERKESDEVSDYISFNFNTETPVELPCLIKDAVTAEILLLVAAYDKINSLDYMDKMEKNAHILSCILLLIKDRGELNSFSTLTKTIINYINSHLSEKICLSDIGRLTYFSPVYCDTVFKQETGKSVIDYLIDKRVDKAKSLMLEGFLSLSEISQSVGFSDYNYFSRVFKKRTRYSPSTYRKMIIYSNKDKI